MPLTHQGTLLHIVFSTKQQLKLLHKTWREDLYRIIGGIAEDRGAVVRKVGGTNDHVHLLLEADPEVAVSAVVQTIKDESAEWIDRNSYAPVKFQWQCGHGVFSVNQSSAQDVAGYIKNQEMHHLAQSFEDEYFSILDKCKIDYDRQYVFDDVVVV